MVALYSYRVLPEPYSSRTSDSQHAGAVMALLRVCTMAFSNRLLSPASLKEDFRGFQNLVQTNKQTHTRQQD